GGPLRCGRARRSGAPASRRPGGVVPVAPGAGARARPLVKGALEIVRKELLELRRSPLLLASMLSLPATVVAVPVALLAWLAPGDHPGQERCRAGARNPHHLDRGGAVLPGRGPGRAPAPGLRAATRCGLAVRHLRALAAARAVRQCAGGGGLGAGGRSAGGAEP